MFLDESNIWIGRVRKEITFINMDGPHLWLEQNQRLNRKESFFSVWLWADALVWAFGLGLEPELTLWVSWVTSLLTTDLGLLSLHSYVSSFLIENLFFYLSFCLSFLSVLLLGRSQTNTLILCQLTRAGQADSPIDLPLPSYISTKGGYWLDSSLR